GKIINKRQKKYSQSREELMLKLINRSTPQAYDMNLNDGLCTYDKDVNGGCAIGCDISHKLSKEIYNDNANSEQVFQYLPKRLQKMGGDFLGDIQKIHDNDNNWINTITAQKGKDGLVWDILGKIR